MDKKVLYSIPVFGLLFILAATGMSCSNPGSTGSSGQGVGECRFNVKPSLEYAANRVGTISLSLYGPDPIYYNPKESGQFTYQITYTSTFYTGQESLKLYGEVKSNFGSISNKRFEVEIPEILGDPKATMQGVIGEFTLDLPTSDITSDVTITFTYNVSGVKTKFIVPVVLTTRYDKSDYSFPVYFTGSPVVPQSTVNVQAASGYTSFSISITDAAGCFNNYNAYFYGVPKVYVNSIKLNIPGKGTFNEGNGFGCNVIKSGGKRYISLSGSSATFSCWIDVKKLGIDVPREQCGILGYVEVELEYDCYSKIIKTISVNPVR